MKCIVTIVPGGVVEVDAPDGCTVLDVVRQAFPDVGLSSFSIFHGKEKLTLEQAAATTLSVQRVVLAEAIIGHAPTRRCDERFNISKVRDTRSPAAKGTI